MKRDPKLMLNIAILILLIAGVMLFYNRGGTSQTVDIDVGETSIAAVAAGSEVFRLDYGEIRGVELVEQPDYGEPAGGGETDLYRYGVWRSDAWGEYTVAAMKKLTVCIKLTTDGGVYAVNLESDDTTRSLCEALGPWISEKQAG